MANDEDLSDLFAIPDFWRPSNWLDQSIDDINKQNPLFTFDVSSAACLGASQALIPVSNVQVLNRAEDEDDVFFKLPSLLRELADQGAKQLGEPEPQAPQDEPEPHSPPTDDEDFWLSTSRDFGKPYEYRTWERFEQPEQDTRPPVFITEAGPAAFDSLFATRQGADGAVPDIIDVGPYSACLLSLALGRSSILFSWDTEKNSFVKTTPYLRISGFSLDSIEAIDRLCLDCGKSARHLQAFAEAAFSTATTPTRVALAGVISRLVLVVQSELNSRSRDLRSILHLQAIVQPAQSVLSYFKCLVKKLAKQKHDEGMLSCLFEEAQSAEYRDGLLRVATREVLRIVSKPWIDFVEEWIGLRAENGMPVTKNGPGKGFVKVSDEMWIDDQGFQLQEAEYFLDKDRMPTFIPEDMAQTIFETGRNLQFLREHHPEHLFSRPDVISATMPPSLEWLFEWDAMSKLEAKVTEYRNAASCAIRVPRAEETRQKMRPRIASRPEPEAAELGCFGKSEAQVEANMISCLRKLDQPLEDRGPRDKLTLLLQSGLYRTANTSADASSLSPHWALVPMLSFSPVIEAQSRLINQECMKLLFSTHHVRVHIDLFRQYFLLGNGLLCSRLSHALFDPDLSTAERKTGVALGVDGGGGGVMGLRLGSRRTWPPASSELRLALMGVLSDCYQPPPPPPPQIQQRSRPSSAAPSSSSSSNPSNGKNSLPGDLSFAIRDLSQQEIDRCMSDPDALEALDFLRLAYKPPAPLRPIFTPAILVKYDRVFKLLLRVLRMLYVTNELARFSRVSRDNRDDDGGSDSSRMRLSVEARLFIRQVASYFFQCGVTAPWARFEAWLDKVQTEIAAGNNDCDGGDGGGDDSSGPQTDLGRTGCSSPNVLRDRQERMLDEMMGVLLLRKRQAPVMGLLEDIFGVVLRFVKGLRNPAAGWGL
ncbi:Spindle pole body component alp6 [Madurella mycetomatis]|uniref:Spindle pole body component n=1 Tax=Madurella mycetomatis TaxID=100816 RepID=A0A175WF03_9PEZI|nr:Spindle pole body component alp6 [Madurella mycetomatis]